MKRVYGYGIVDCHDTPWWYESCVCKDRAPLLEVVDDLNHGYWRFNRDGDSSRRPFRVVKLFWLTRAKHKGGK